MNRRRDWVGLILITTVACFLVTDVLSTLPFYYYMRSSGTISYILPLHTEGRYIKDSAGNIVFLRGVTKSGMADSPLGLWAPEGAGGGEIPLWRSLFEYPGDDVVRWNIRKIREMTGANVIKWMMTYEWWMQDPNNHSYRMPPWSLYDYLDTLESYRYYQRRICEIASEEGVYVNLQGFNVEPGAQDNDPFATETGLTGQDIIDWSVSVVDELKDLPNVIFTPWTEVTVAADVWFPILQQAITEIRAISEMPIIVQWHYGVYADIINNATNYSGTLDWIADYPLNGTNLIYSTHMYRQGGAFGTYTYRGFTRDDILHAFQLEKVDWAVQNYPFLLDETGRHINAPDLDNENMAWTNLLSIMNEWDIGYIATHWTFTGHMTLALLESIPDSGWIPPLNDAGEILANAIQSAP